jgi:chitinase
MAGAYKLYLCPAKCLHAFHAKVVSNFSFTNFNYRSFKYATGLNQPHGGNDVANWPDDDGTPQYFNIYNKLPEMIQMRDNKSKTQYAYTSRLEQPGLQLPEGLVSFDDER